MQSFHDRFFVILQLAGDGIKRDVTQGYLDQANYTFEKKNGETIVKVVKETLGDYFRKKKKAAEVGYCYMYTYIHKKEAIEEHLRAERPKVAHDLSMSVKIPCCTRYLCLSLQHPLLTYLGKHVLMA